MNNEQFIVIGKKTKKVNSLLIWIIILAILIFASFKIRPHETVNLFGFIYFIVVLFVLDVILLINYLFYLSLPDILILMSDYSLIINKKSGEIEIPLFEVREVIQKNMYYRYKMLSYGKIIICTNSMGDFKVYGVENVDRVKTAILLHLPRRYTGNNSYYDER